MTRPIEPAVREKMNAIASILDDALPDDYGFVFLTFQFNTKGRMNYISNAQRDDMIAAMEELLSNLRSDTTTVGSPNEHKRSSRPRGRGGDGRLSEAKPLTKQERETVTAANAAWRDRNPHLYLNSDAEVATRYEATCRALEQERDRLRDEIESAPCLVARPGELTRECDVNKPCRVCEWRREALAAGHGAGEDEGR